MNDDARQKQDATTQDNSPPCEMQAGVERRTFLKASGVSLTGALATSLAPSALAAAKAEPRPVGMTDVGPEWTGPGGVGDYSSANGNTHVDVKRGHGMIRNHEQDQKIASARLSGEEYDLIVVGAGIAGLTAAYTYRKAKPSARILVLEAADIIGGVARANEFDVGGYRLIGKQGSSACGSILPDGSFMPWHPFYHELGLPSAFTHQKPEGLTNDIIFPADDWLPMFPNYKGADVGYYFEGKGFIRNPWSNGFEDAPISDGLKKDLMKMAAFWRVPYREDWRQKLDSMPYEQWWHEMAGVSPDAVYFAEGPMRASLQGLGTDVISGMDVANVYYEHREQFFKPVIPSPFAIAGPVSRNVELPGGNATIARKLLQHLVPDAYGDTPTFASFVRASLRRETLDRPGQAVRVRLDSVAVSVQHVGKVDKAVAVDVVYNNAGKDMVRVRGRNVIMGGQQHVNKNVCRDITPAIKAAMNEFNHAPILSVNIALNNWRFFDKAGISHARWFEGFGWFGGLVPEVVIEGAEQPPFHPDKPAVMTWFIPFLDGRGMPAPEQSTLARHAMYALSYADIEAGVSEQLERMFKPYGFDSKRDIAGIVANRMGHAYVVTPPGFYFGKNGGPPPSAILRQGHGRIGFAHTELMGSQLWFFAAIEGMRAAGAAVAKS
ncbi:NAD(P)-binding protein [Novosphingobium sp. MW5]|nr:NAD(P)-binding protein [Novosphingobium sp. MW5]